MITEKLRFMTGLVGVALLTSVATTAHAQSATEVVLVNGTHWTESDERAKIGFLYGIGNFAHVERAMYGDNMPGDKDSLVPVLYRGLDGRPMSEIKDALDKWYQDNPDRIDRPVIETIYFELALPNS